jgi:uncharacterized membrane protein YkoI
MRFVLFIMMIFGVPVLARAEGTPFQNCVSPREMQDVVASAKIVAPAAAITVARQAVPNADVVRAQLCRSDDVLVYIIIALRQDGRIVHVRIDAPSGRVKSAQ